MHLRRVFIIALVAASAAASAVSAGTLRADDGPAEVPPASYAANQYVDSRGCVYVRAGYAGQVTWVPRVTRERKVLCGFKPSLAAEAPAAPAPKVAAKPAEDSAAKPAAPAVAPAARVAQPPRKAKTPPATVGAPMATVALTETPPKIGAAAAAAKRSSAPEVPAAKTAAPAPLETAEKRNPACPGASEISRGYINDGRAGPVRCGPQAEAPAGRRVARATPNADAPRRVAVAASAPQPVTVPRRVVQPAPVKIPAGYEPAWKDDRLNPMRGKGSAEGKAQMDLLWTETVPRRLIDVTTGRDVTTQLAHVKYPYTDYAMQQRHLGRASTKATPEPRVAATSKSQRPAVATTPTAAAADSHRFVQVGMFGVPANAEATRARLRALGLPVAVARSRAGGQEMQTVFAGPFETQAQLTSALGAVRKAGYGDAFLRK
ncbi:SPOR domain-containing protein [Actibacterium sp. MT2.3-13A]|uniref:SPOR domain-containing protein n=1 Tax=Actibacterium sp. MT2.3-13A TaxID=2828332 RepID=UPI001BAADB97|nr:SPOR domain-containing protein [Actibacterium sp. MT2.3-13A]